MSQIPQGTATDYYRQQGWWPNEPVTARFARLVSAEPSVTAVRDDQGQRLNRAELWRSAEHAAATLARYGVEAGAVVLICLPNTVFWQTAYLGCLRLGAIPATIPVTTDPETLGYVADLIGAAALIAAPDYHGNSAGAAAYGAAERSGRSLVLWLSNADTPVRTGGQRAEATPRAGLPDIAQLMFTSSTTGPPKAVAHTENTLSAVNLGFARRFDLTASDTIFMPSPLGHSVGSWHGARLSLFTGAELVLQQRWEPRHARELINAHGATFTAAATPFLKDLVDTAADGDRAALGSLRTFLCGGAPVPPALLEQTAVCAPNTFVSVLWGMTEGGVTTCLPTDPASLVAASAGTGLPGLELCTVDERGQPVEPGTEGELAMRGPGVFVGYIGQPELYHEQLTEHGFFRTGDLARLDEVDGVEYLKLTGRLKDLIVRGGVNISPVPLENALAAHPAVRRVAVIGVPDERLGERICAVVEPSSTLPELTTLTQWLGQRGLPQRHWPEKLWVIDGMPQNATGKIRKVDLRERAAKELG
ncbi:cyclohexanecarboxylate-CoA ligase [Tamaricihabitans halophyticus]|uniref:Cyclohexanecarboxylate-CoA ligase n=1 Tax=Tamaricihabitans halophyticus TaxID=1262583 RepID=A0A4R2QFN5_9PSEU|nr:AMP-binding protein [Tamaricihabitans halophyticus]TCP47877.1 cyclohexanecarboxylate-CoA ligase [Tamaricihabitans halophyticus]